MLTTVLRIAVVSGRFGVGLQDQKRGKMMRGNIINMVDKQADRRVPVRLLSKKLRTSSAVDMRRFGM